MNDDIREVFAAALPESEPPLATHGPELAVLGRKRQRRRRIGFTASGATFAVAAVAAAALVVPGLLPGVGPDNAANARAETDPKVLSEQVREAMADAFPDVEFGIDETEGTGDEPFDLSLRQHFDLWSLRGSATVMVDGEDTGQIVTVSLIPPGDWSAEPQEDFSHDVQTLFLTDCVDEREDENGRSAKRIGAETSSKCDSEDLGKDGVRYTSKETITGTKDEGGDTGIDNRGKNGVRYSNALQRLDGTAVTLFNGCGLDTTDVKTCEAEDLIVSDSDAVVDYLVNVPTVALDYKK